MRKFLLLLALPLLVGCTSTAGNIAQSLTGFTVTQQKAGEALVAYNAVEAASLKYEGLPVCTAGQTFLKNACHDADVATKLAHYRHLFDPKRRALTTDLATAQASGSDVGVAKAAVDAVTAGKTTIKAEIPAS